MTRRLEIQGRLVKWRKGVIVRDSVRLGSAITMDEARVIADEFVADGFTVWIFEVQTGSQAQPHYRGVGFFRPNHKASPVSHHVKSPTPTSTGTTRRAA